MCTVVIGSNVKNQVSLETFVLEVKLLIMLMSLSDAWLSTKCPLMLLSKIRWCVDWTTELPESQNQCDIYDLSYLTLMQKEGTKEECERQVVKEGVTRKKWALREERRLVTLPRATTQQCGERRARSSHHEHYITQPKAIKCPKKSCRVTYLK